jgi:hypothetical protein
VKKPKAKTLADFQAIHDVNVRVPRIIEAGLASLRSEGREAHENDQEFMRRCGSGMGPANYAKFRERYRAWYVEISAPGYRKGTKRIWFGDKAVAAKARRIVSGG